jgi:hypothetical protein
MAQIKMETSRFSNLPAQIAKAILAAFIILMFASLWPAFQQIKADAKAKTASAASVAEAEKKRDEVDPDLALYTTIIRRIRSGENYYAVAVDEQRRGGYPVTPFVTVRLPTTAFIIANLGDTGAHILKIGIAVLALLAWFQKLKRLQLERGRLLVLLGLVAAGLSPTLITFYLTMHEIWAGALLCLSLGLYRPDKWLPSLIAAACALAVRELALPFVLLMAAFALVQRRWSETFAWAAVVLAFAIMMFWHMQAVNGLVRASDAPSPPWLVMGGPSAALNFMWQTSALRKLPIALAYPMIVASLFGWLSWRSQTALFGLLMLLGYMLLFSLTGRANNFYWSLMVSPFLVMGIAFLRPGVSDLMAAFRDPKPLAQSS